MLRLEENPFESSFDLASVNDTIPAEFKHPFTQYSGETVKSGSAMLPQLQPSLLTAQTLDAMNRQ